MGALNHEYDKGTCHLLTNSIRLVLIPIPFAELIIDIQHPGTVEDMRGRLDIVPLLYFPILVSRQLTAPKTPGTPSGVMSSHNGTAFCAAMTTLPGFVFNTVDIDANVGNEGTGERAGQKYIVWRNAEAVKYW